jgi:hypothetical protein
VALLATQQQNAVGLIAREIEEPTRITSNPMALGRRKQLPRRNRGRFGSSNSHP